MTRRIQLAVLTLLASVAGFALVSLPSCSLAENLPAQNNSLDIPWTLPLFPRVNDTAVWPVDTARALTLSRKTTQRKRPSSSTKKKIKLRRRSGKKTSKKNKPRHQSCGRHLTRRKQPRVQKKTQRAAPAAPRARRVNNVIAVDFTSPAAFSASLPEARRIVMSTQRTKPNRPQEFDYYTEGYTLQLSVTSNGCPLVVNIGLRDGIYLNKFADLPGTPMIRNIHYPDQSELSWSVGAMIKLMTTISNGAVPRQSVWPFFIAAESIRFRLIEELVRDSIPSQEIITIPRALLLNRWDWPKPLCDKGIGCSVTACELTMKAKTQEKVMMKRRAVNAAAKVGEEGTHNIRRRAP